MENEYYACPPVDESLYDKMGLDFTPKPGSVQRACLMCSKMVWFGTNQQEKEKGKKLPIICFVCYVNHGGGTTQDKIIACGPGGHDYNETGIKFFGA